MSIFSKTLGTFSYQAPGHYISVSLQIRCDLEASFPSLGVVSTSSPGI